MTTHTVVKYEPDGGVWGRAVFRGTYDECLAFIDRWRVLNEGVGDCVIHSKNED